MKKLNLADMVMTIVMLAMTGYGVYMMETQWVEVGSAVIWVAGMVAIAVIYIASRFVGPINKMAQYIQEVYEKMLDQM